MKNEANLLEELQQPPRGHLRHFFPQDVYGSAQRQEKPGGELERQRFPGPRLAKEHECFARAHLKGNAAQNFTFVKAHVDVQKRDGGSSILRRIGGTVLSRWPPL